MVSESNGHGVREFTVVMKDVMVSVKISDVHNFGKKWFRYAVPVGQGLVQQQRTHLHLRSATTVLQQCNNSVTKVYERCNNGVTPV
jgi:hypothetical protein